MASSRAGIPKAFQDLALRLEASGFKLVFESPAVIVHEKGKLRVTINDDRGVWYLTIDEARVDAYLADAFDADVWRVLLEGGAASTTPVAAEEIAAMVVRNLAALETAVAPDNIAGARARLEDISNRRFIEQYGQEAWMTYQKKVQEMRGIRRHPG